MNRRFPFFVGVLLLVPILLIACKNETPLAMERSLAVVTQDVISAAPTSIPERTQIRWFVGLETGTDPIQVEIQQAVVDSFNVSQADIELVLEIVPPDAAEQELLTQIAAGDAPDIIGPISMGGAHAFHGQWLDLAPLIETTHYDMRVYKESHIRFYQTDEGQVSLPFAIYPSGLYYQKAMFDEAGLNHPPQNLGDPYLWVDGTEVEWSWDTLAEVARMLTKDANGFRANEAGFGSAEIIQTGYHPQWSHPNIVGTSWLPGQIYNTETLTSTAAIPAPWKDSWRWWFDGMWGEQPFIADGALAASPEFGGGNLFNSGRVAMSLTQLWYTCCIEAAGTSWDIAALPSNEGLIYGRMDESTFRIWKGTQNPAAAFEVLTYLTGPEGVQPLLLGNDAHPGGAYNALPALAEFQAAYIDLLAAQYPHVENWDIFLQSQDYPDIPSAESWMPDFARAWSRIGEFQLLIEADGGIDLDAEIETLESDLEIIFNQ